jgi:hypothetical protein
MGLNVLGRSRYGILRLRLEAESNDPIVRWYRHERDSFGYTRRPAHVVDLHRINGGRLVAGPAGVLNEFLKHRTLNARGVQGDL